MKITVRKIWQCIARGCDGCTVCSKPLVKEIVTVCKPAEKQKKQEDSPKNQ